ncbi:MAG: Ig-like domain-containing protein, partial [bacterium]
MNSMRVCNSAQQGQCATTTTFRKLRKVFGLAIAAIGLSASVMSAQAVEYVAATGGTVTTYSSGGNLYSVHTFTGSGTFTVQTGGSVQYLVVGGGGGGGGGTGGGGGAGGFLTGTTSVSGSGTEYAVTVGAGGAGGTTVSPCRGSNGVDSVFASITAVGGGGGGSNYPNSPGYTEPTVGGSGGGASGDPSLLGANGTSLQGNAGGGVTSWNNPYTPGGGGGAGAVGTTGAGQNAGAPGGAGLSSTITGTEKWYAGGGGSGNFFGSSGGTGGSGIGGHGGQGANGNASGCTSGTVNTGSGGGGQGGNSANAAGSGGSGIVIISYVSGLSDNPSSVNASLTALEDVQTALATNNFGYVDPKSVALAAVQITAVPALGTVKLSGTPVTLNQIVAVADINSSNLTYQSALNGNGTPYTTIGIKVMNASNLWSDAAVMTVNVTPVNDAPTSTGGSVILHTDTVKAFATSNFQYSDVEGSPISAVKVTSLPTHGMLKLGETSVALNDVIPVASIPTLTYTSNTGYTGADSFQFQVSDAALFSADATMAISVTAGIPVLNGSFEDPTPHNPNNGAPDNSDWTAGGWAFLPAPWTSSHGLNYSRISYAPMVGTAQPGPWICNLNGSIWIKQDLGATVTEGDILSVTCQVMSDTLPGIMEISFLVGSGPTVYSQIFTNPVNNNVWVTSYMDQTGSGRHRHRGRHPF